MVRQLRTVKIEAETRSGRLALFATIALCSIVLAFAILSARPRYPNGARTVLGLLPDSAALGVVDMRRAIAEAVHRMPALFGQRRRLDSTNPLERRNAAIKRRTDVVGIFPKEVAITGLIGALLMEQDDEQAAAPLRAA